MDFNFTQQQEEMRKTQALINTLNGRIFHLEQNQMPVAEIY